MFKRKEAPKPQESDLSPDKSCMRKAWVALEDGRVGYIDHYKPDGRFGVRPITHDGRFFKNPSEHWTEEQRLAHPEELSLSINEFRGAELEEIPPVWRHGVRQ